ncbi:hydroxyacylglutathione hydrolase [Acetobacter fabarum]|uniref:hydroxyacylglutathione hydrolase n=1 Tax=Acetobacter fabarum TaxID=483199 RepID=UPI00312B5C11
MPLTIRAIPVLSDNYAWLLRDEATGTTAIIDPGEAVPIERALAQDGNRLDFILLTHHHHDHTGGTDALRTRYHAKVAGPAVEQHRMPALDLPLHDNDRLEIGLSAGRILAMPGHTLGHIAYYFDQPPALFCGDTLFSLGCGRLFEGTAEQMFASLSKLRDLPAQTSICCGHEYTLSNALFALSVDPENPALATRAQEVRALRDKGLPTVPSTLGLERTTNPFLRAPDAQALASLRKRKDEF